MTAALCMSALDDTEDDFPTRPNLRAMPNDQDDSREATTLAPDTDRGEERDTQPPDPIVEAKLSTMIPAANTPQTIEELAKSELVVLYRKAISMHESLLGAEGLLEQNRRGIVDDISTIVDRGFQRVVERLEPRLDAQGLRITELERKVGAMQTDLDETRRQLALLKAERAPGSPTPPQPEPA